MKNFKVSVIIPTFNRCDLLKECIDSVLAQDYKNLEIIVTDDNSTDKTSEIVKNYQKRFSNIKYVLNIKYPQGPNGNKNNGLDNASGDIICILDDDDKLISNYAISIMVKKLNDGYDLVLCNCIRSDTKEFSGKGVNKSGELEYKDYLCGKLSGEFFSIFKKSLLDDKRFDTDLYGGESTLWRGLWKKAKVYYIHKAYRFYRIHEGVSSNSKKKSNIVIKNYERDIEYYGDDMKKFCPCYLASIYKGAAYFAKLSNQYKKGFKYLFNSIRYCPKYKATYIMLLVMFLPNKFVLLLTRFRVFIRNKIGY